MTSFENVPYADSEPLPEIIEECRCVEAECAAHGVDLHPRHHGGDSPHPHAQPLAIAETTRHIVDGYPEYGS